MSIMSPNGRLAVTVTEQLRGDRVAVCLIVDQNAAEIVAGRRVEFLEKGAQIVIHGSGPPSDRSIHPGSPVEIDRCFAW